MRIAAGSLMIIVSLFLPAIYQSVVDMSAPEDAESIGMWMLLPMLILFLLSVGGAVNASKKKGWNIALAGAICSMLIGFAVLILFTPLGFIFFPMGILAFIFIIKRRGEFE